MRKAICITAAAIAAFFMLPFFGAVAYAAEIDIPSDDEPVVTPSATVEEPPSVPVTDYPERNPFTPSGAGTVVNSATDEDGKEFYTVMTPDEHVFYLVIDRQRGQENVYFLNAVTVADLAALAEQPKAESETEPVPASAEQPPAEATPTPVTPVTEQQTGGGNTIMYVIIAVLAVLGGGAGWYFKIYRPKQQGAADGDEYEPHVDKPEYGDWDDEPEVADDEDDSPPWDVDEDGAVIEDESEADE